MNLANPPLFQGDNQVILQFDDTGAMDVLLEIEVTASTLRAPLEDRVLGEATALFDAIDSWQPQRHSSLAKTGGNLMWSTTAERAELQTSNVFFDKPVSLRLQYQSDRDSAARLYWRSEHSDWNAQNSIAFKMTSSSNPLEKVFEISPAMEVDELRFEVEQPGTNISIQAIELADSSNTVLHSWEF